ncbi:sushi domain-containing protein 2-like isoform X2 [Patiria miniata]|uniref:Sushi domain-containing protein 2-like n=1 Tax=Patiria miniata TaxID=46514 RepID=A0A914ANE4_PATMI|nr:sushi domain-containing protein 2-like isoform X2 [Patiria miniata]
METTFVTVLLVLALAVVATVNGQKLFPFGQEIDSRFPTENDVSVKVDLGSPFTYYGKKYSSVFVNDNGVLSFVNDLAQFGQWEQLPLSTPGEQHILIAPFLADVDLTVRGAIFYREATDEATKQKAKDKVTEYFVRHSDFKPKNVFIVTWDNVGFQGSTADIPQTNTFQCVVTSDAVNTFVFFVYQNIAWYASVSAGGNEAGIGSNMPQVGFESGDGKNNEIINVEREYGNPTELPKVSNVDPADPPGFFIYQVSGSSVSAPQCTKFAAPQVYPNHASMLGGSKLTFGGLCFGENDDIRFRFSDKDVVSLALSEVVGCDYVSAYQATCVMPLMDKIGDVKASLSTDGGSTFKDVDFTLMPIDSVAPGVLQKDAWTMKWLKAIEPLEISWDKSMFNDTKVNITIMSYREENQTTNEGAYEWVNTVIAANVANSGEYTITVGPNPAITKNNVMGVIRVTAASKPNGMTLTSGMHFLGYLLGEDGYQTDSQTWSDNYCKAWYEKDKLKEDFIDDLNACPCSLEQALADQARFVANPYCDSTKQPAGSPLNYCFARPEIKHCVLGIVRNPSKADSECCYDGDGNLVYAQDSDYGSFSNRISRFSGAVPGLSGATTDLVPYIFCIVVGDDHFHYFREQRPTKDCREYEPVRPAMIYGDPHFETFDGTGYTFNGLGEYVLVRTVTGAGATAIRVQGRFERVDDENGVKRNATVLTTLVIMENNNPQNKIQIERDDITLMTLKVGPSATPQDIGRSAYQQYPDFFVSFPENTGNGVVPKMIFLFRMSKIGLMVEATEGMLSAMILLPSEYKGKTKMEGLFGNWDEDESDDLKTPSGTVIDDTSTEAIYRDFGQQWEADDPIFVYYGSATHQTYQDNSFRPILEPPTGGVSERELERVCGDDKFCRFDYAVTEREAVAAQTAKDSKAMEKTMLASDKLLMCPFPPTPSHGEKEFVGEARHHAPGSVIRYTCGDGYIFFGNSQRVCDERGVWSDTTEPSCEEAKCGNLNAPEHGSMDVTQDGDVITATFKCDEGARLEGSETRTCGEDNKWTGQETKCIRGDPRGGNNNTAVIVIVVIVVIIVLVALAGGIYYFYKKRSSSGAGKVTRPPDSAYQPVSGEVADVELGTKKDKSSEEDEGGFKDKDTDKDKDKDKEKEKLKDEADEKVDKDIEKDSD